MKKINFIVFLFALSIVSCNSKKDKYKHATTFTYHDFSIKKDLRATTLKFDSLIMLPMDLLAFDSVLITIESGKEKIFHVYNIKKGTHINACIRRGQGPEDMLQPEFMNSDDKYIKIIDLATSTIYEYEKEDFITNPQPKPMNRIQLEKQIFLTAQQIKDKIMGCSYAGDKRLYVFDLNGKEINSIIDYPPTTIPQSEIEKRDAYYMKFISNEIDRIALCYYMTDLIEIYDLEGALLKRLHGPEQFFSRFKEYHDGEYIGASPEKGLNRDAYMCPRNAGDEFFVLFNGGYIDEPNHTTFCKKIFSFTWDGIPNKMFNLDDPIFSFSVDSKNKKIYGISETPEFHIVTYSY